MPRYVPFLDEPIDPTDFDVKFNPDALLTKNTGKLADAVVVGDDELYYAMSRFYAVSIFEAEGNRATE